MPFAFVLLAAQAATPAPAAQPTPAPAERKICRSESVTGSIMPARRVCHTRAEWAAFDAASGRGVDAFRDRPRNGLRPGE